MAGSAMVFTEVTYAHIKKIKATWTSDSATGAVSGTTTNAFTGQIIGFICVPATGGDAPTTLYDVVINNEDGRDILHGVGADRPVPLTDSGRIHPSLLLGSCVGTTLTFSITNAGNSKQGTIYLYIG